MGGGLELVALYNASSVSISSGADYRLYALIEESDGSTHINNAGCGGLSNRELADWAASLPPDEKS